MTQTSPGVNRQNRYSQVQEAGKILPTRKFPLTTGKVSYLVRGTFRAFASVDSHRLIAGPLHGETLMENGGADQEYRWVTQSLDRYRGKTIHIELSPVQDKSFSVVQIIEGLPPAVPPLPNLNPTEQLDRWNATVALAKQPSVPSGPSLTLSQQADLSVLYQTVIDHPELWLGPNNGQLEPSKVEVIRKAIETVQGLAKQSKQSDDMLAAKVTWQSQLALAMRDGSGINDHVLIRGNHLHPGHEVPRRSLTAIGGREHEYQGKGSGRLALAEELLQPENPLVGRVIANRIWHHLLGRGIVPSTDDFGVLGLRPTHPELLDSLANELVDRGWSLKALIRSVMLSSVYRQDSKPSPRATESDPDNQWLSHARVRRLEAESIRDTLLAVSGQLDQREIGRAHV